MDQTLECISSKPTLFFDLDGPLVDVSRRYVALHQDLLRESGECGMDPELYWQRKRARFTEEAILEELGLAKLAPTYVPARLARIETPEYLAHDRAWDWARPTLHNLAGSYHLVLVTARGDRALLMDQLRRLGLRESFDEVYSEPAGRLVHEQKAASMRKFLVRENLESSRHWIVGDTEADIAAGKLLELGTVGVLSGIRDRERLSESGPDFLLNDIRELPLILGK